MPAHSNNRTPNIIGVEALTALLDADVTGVHLGRFELAWNLAFEEVQILRQAIPMKSPASGEGTLGVAMIAAMLAPKSEQRPVDAASFRDRSGIGRNLTIEVLEFFDRADVTRFAGGQRRISGTNLRSGRSPGSKIAWLLR